MCLIEMIFLNGNKVFFNLIIIIIIMIIIIIIIIIIIFGKRVYNLVARSQ